MHPKTMFWFSSTLIGAIVALALLMMHMSEVEAALPIVLDIIYGGAALAVLYVLYNAWHKVSTKQLERKSLAQEIDRAGKDQANIQALEQRRMDIELARIQAEEHKAQLEHERLMVAIQWQAQHLIIPEGQTAIFADQDRSYVEIHAPRHMPQIAASSLGKDDDKQPITINALFPEPQDFVQILASFRPCSDAIFLMDTTDRIVTVPMNKVCHVGLGGPTGGGKTNTTRLLISQLLACDAPMYMANPNFNPVKLNGDHIEDWRPIVRKLSAPVARDIDDIMSLLDTFLKEFEKRKKNADTSIRRGKDLFLILCELPAIIAQDKSAAVIISRLLREARQYGIHLISEFQDALVSTIGGSSGVRENYRTGYYFGGDLKTAQILLDLAKGERVEEEGIGQKGAVYLRCESSKARAGRVPYFSNQALYILLGTPPDPMPDRPITDEDDIPETFYTLDTSGRYIDPTSGKPVTVVEGTIETRSEGLDTPSEINAVHSYQTRTTGPLSTLLETTEDTSDERFPRLNEIQEAQFSAAYKIKPNIDVCLKTISVGTAYRDHAREIVRRMKELGEVR
jgi:hypothetical protein